MIRRASAVVFALAIHPAMLQAQDVFFTVTVPSADVHTGPTTVTPVVGQVTRGAVLAVSRNLGSWIKVAWPAAPEGNGYVHVTMGRLGQNRADGAAAGASARVSAPPPAVATSVGASPATTAPPSVPVSSQEPIKQPRDGVGLRAQQSVHPIGHVFGVGGLVGSFGSFGATARAWRPNRLGIQVGITHDAMTSDVDGGRVTSVQFEPAVVYALLDHVTDDLWLRPYVGSGASFRHQTLSGVVPAAAQPTDNGVGFRVFGGSELMFAAAPQLGLSADIGYRRLPTVLPGFDVNGIGVSIAAHWYMK